ncbi:hypothetical protein N9N28_07580 [Rubripirellula amarantea]|nr:hypothetical protein [Rubripirellula amarantea]
MINQFTFRWSRPRSCSTLVFLFVAFWGQATIPSIVTAADVQDDAPAASSSPLPDASEAGSGSDKATVSEDVVAESDQDDVANEAWDYSPYRVLVWVASDDARFDADAIAEPLRDFLDRDFASIWRMKVRQTPSSLHAIMNRDMGLLNYDSITGVDPVLAVKKDHDEAIRIRVADDVAKFVKKIYTTKDAVDSLVARGEASGDATLGGLVQRFEVVSDNPIVVAEKWTDPSTEAILVSRGLALTLDEPEAKLVKPDVQGLIADQVEDFDKVYLVNVKTNDVHPRLEIVEMDVLMRYFGPVSRMPINVGATPSQTVGLGLMDAFAPTVRIDNAGQKNASGLLRASGLIITDESPGLVSAGDVLRPLTRKNDRNGNPFLIGPIDWAYLVVDKREGTSVEMDFYAGRSGGLQGRKNNRTFRTAIKAKPQQDHTILRLHAQGKPNEPLIGYEIYQKELTSKSMTFIGRTDWSGRLKVDRTDEPLRLMYVKNGGAVLARLPMVPGLEPVVIADLRGDDLRLQAEAYIRGVQNSIIDLVAVRELFKARIRMRLERGELDNAKELMNALNEQPSNEALADDMGKKQAIYLKLLEKEGPNQRRQVDQMFTTTRDLLAKHINPKLIRDLETDIIKATQNGGKLPAAKPKDDDEGEEVAVADDESGNVAETAPTQ